MQGQYRAPGSDFIAWDQAGAVQGPDPSTGGLITVSGGGAGLRPPDPCIQSWVRAVQGLIPAH